MMHASALHLQVTFELELSMSVTCAQVFVRFDTQTGSSQSWSPGPRCFCEELIFVPGPTGAAKEDDGVLLGMVFDGETQRSSLVVRNNSNALGNPVSDCAFE